MTNGNSPSETLLIWTFEHWNSLSDGQRIKLAIDLQRELVRTRAALADEIGLVQLIACRPEISESDRLSIYCNHRHLHALNVLDRDADAAEERSREEIDESAATDRHSYYP